MAVMVCALGCALADEPRVLFDENFDGSDTSPLLRKLLPGGLAKLAKGKGPDGSTALRVAYVGYEKGSMRLVARLPLAAAVESATLFYDVKFADDFQWTHGGKLHGVGPVTSITGGEKRVPEGWSSRVNFGADGRVKTYLYDQDPDKKWGAGTTTAEPVFKRGVWHHVEFYTKLNTPGENDGVARIKVDGREVLTTQGVQFRGVGGAETLISSFLFSTFHGGNTDKWTPRDAAGDPTTVYAWFDNFRVVEGSND